MQTTPSAHFDDLPGGLPPDRIPEDLDLSPFAGKVGSILENPTAQDFTADALWRDFLCMNGAVRTFDTASKILDIWTRQSQETRPSAFNTHPADLVRVTPDSCWVVVPFEFTATRSNGLVGSCSGTANLIPDDDGAWKIWMLTTVLEQFQGQGNPDVATEEMKEGQHMTNGINGHVEPNGQIHEDNVSVAIVGAGQSGLCLAGRLAALGISYVLLDRNPQVGDSWTGKYDAVRQHTVRQYNHLPFDPTWDQSEELLLPAKKVAEGFQRYVKRYNINVWLSTSIDECARDDQTGQWTLKVNRDGESRIIRSKHLSLAMGAGLSVPKKPSIPNESTYTGELIHASIFKNSKRWSGKSGTVIGSGTTAHDVAQDMFNHGMSPVTLIQRTKTAVYPCEWHVSGLAHIYNDNMPTTLSDRMSNASPNKIGRDIVKDEFERGYVAEAERFVALQRAGFKVDFDSHLLDKIFRDYGGYYIDVGTSARIAAGDIQVKSGVPIKSYTPAGLEFEDGGEVKSDVIVLATGYEGDYRRQVATVIGDERASKLGDFWGIDDEGEVRGVMKPMAPGLWLMGGAAVHARWWSRFVALQLQADLMGKPLQQPPAQSIVTNGVH